MITFSRGIYSKQFSKQTWIKCSNSCKLVYTCVCALHSNASLIIGTRAYNVNKIYIMISKGRSLIGRAGCSIHDLQLLYLSSRAKTILVMTNMWPVTWGMGFLNFPKTFRWRLCIWQNNPFLAFWFKINFLKDFPNLDSFVVIYFTLNLWNLI